MNQNCSKFAPIIIFGCSAGIGVSAIFIIIDPFRLEHLWNYCYDTYTNSSIYYYMRFKCGVDDMKFSANQSISFIFNFKWKNIVCGSISMSNLREGRERATRSSNPSAYIIISYIMHHFEWSSRCKINRNLYVSMYTLLKW